MKNQRLPLYWLPRLHKRPYKSRFIANSSACTTTELSNLLTSCLSAITNHVIKYCTTVYERNGKKLFWSIKNSGETLNKLKSRGFLASGLSTYDFSTLYTTLPNNLVKEILTELIEQTFNREGSLYLACNDKNALFTFEHPKQYTLWSCVKMCDALHYLLGNIFIRFGSKLYRQIVGNAYQNKDQYRTPSNNWGTSNNRSTEPPPKILIFILGKEIWFCTGRSPLRTLLFVAPILSSSHAL